MSWPQQEDSNQLGWLIDDFVQSIPNVLHAAVVTTDGLVLVFSEEIPKDDADQLAAITSGLASLTDGAADCFGAAPVHQVIVEMAGGYLFVTRVSDGSALAVMCNPACDIGLVGYEMSLLISRIGDVLSPDLRAAPSRPGLPTDLGAVPRP